jgi:hypothetical protein
MSTLEPLVINNNSKNKNYHIKMFTNVQPPSFCYNKTIELFKNIDTYDYEDRIKLVKLWAEQIVDDKTHFLKRNLSSPITPCIYLSYGKINEFHIIEAVNEAIKNNEWEKTIELFSKIHFEITQVQINIIDLWITHFLQIINDS